MEPIKDYKDLLSLLDGIHFNWPKGPFRPSEFFLSSTADKLGISNFPDDPEVLENLLKLIKNILVPVRKRINMPIIISSGYRCPKLNTAVGGAANSYHMFGRAVDIYCANNKTLDEAIVAVNDANVKAHLPVLKEFIRYKNFIHIAL